MKNIALLAALSVGIYLVSKKDKIKKQLTSIGSNDISAVLDEDFGIVRPPKNSQNSGIIPWQVPSSNVPQSSSGSLITIEDGTLDLSENIAGYQSGEIPKVPQYTGSLEGKIFYTEFGDIYVVKNGSSYKTDFTKRIGWNLMRADPILPFGKKYPQNAIPVRDVPMYFLDNYPSQGTITNLDSI